MPDFCVNCAGFSGYAYELLQSTGMEYKIEVQLWMWGGVVKLLFTTTVSITLVGPSPRVSPIRGRCICVKTCISEIMYETRWALQIIIMTGTLNEGYICKRNINRQFLPGLLCHSK
jgi:hypothetical protein